MHLVQGLVGGDKPPATPSSLSFYLTLTKLSVINNTFVINRQHK